MKNLPRGKVYPFRKSQRSGSSNHRAERRLAWFFNWKWGWGRNVRRRRRFFSKYAVPFLILVVLGGLTYAALFSSLFTLKSIEVSVVPEGDELEVESLKQEIKKRFSGKNLLFIKQEQLSFLEDEAPIERVKLRKRWPSSLEVLVVKRVARAILEDAGKKWFLVDEKGVVFAPALGADLSVIGYPSESLSIGAKVQDREINFTLYLLKRVGQEKFEIESVRVDSQVTLKIVDGPEVVLPLDEKDVDRMIEVINDFRSRGVALIKVDLRYKNPVLEY